MPVAAPDVGVELFTAAPPSRSLLTVPGVLVTPGDGRWVNGIDTMPDDCNVDLDLADAENGDWPYWWTCATGATPVATLAAVGGWSGEGRKLISARPSRVLGQSMTVWAGVQCSASDVHSEVGRDEINGQARRKLAALIPSAVERELWTGVVTTAAGFANPFLQDQTTVTNIGALALTGFVTALAELEQALASNANLTGRSMIHAQPRVVTAWASRGLVVPSPDGTHLRTLLGTAVNPGVGYTGASAEASPTAASGTSSFAFATGLPHVWLGTPTPPAAFTDGAFDRSLNTVEVRTEVEALVLFDPCAHFQVRVNLCDEYCAE